MFKYNEDINLREKSTGPLLHTDVKSELEFPRLDCKLELINYDRHKNKSYNDNVPLHDTQKSVYELSLDRNLFALYYAFFMI